MRTFKLDKKRTKQTERDVTQQLWRHTTHTCTVPGSLILVAEEGVLQLSNQSAVFNTVMLSPENSNGTTVHPPNVCSV